MAPSFPAPAKPSTLATVLQFLAAIAVLYLFLIGIGAMGTAFKGMGKGFSERQPCFH